MANVQDIGVGVGEMAGENESARVLGGGAKINGNTTTEDHGLLIVGMSLAMVGISGILV